MGVCNKLGQETKLNPTSLINAPTGGRGNGYLLAR